MRKAATDGRILAHELEDRLATALRAQTYGELDAVTADLPGGRIAHVPYPRRAVQRQPVATVAILVSTTVVALVVAAVVLAGLIAFSGVWLVFALLWMVRGGGRAARRGHHHHRGYPAYRNLPGRW